MNKALIPFEQIQKAIILLRGQKVMLDRDLASLYGVPTKALKQAVKRNADRFPGDLMFILDVQEFENWRSQFVTSKSDRKGLRHAPMAFTEQGVAMLSSVLNSERAIRVNIAVVRAFVQLRQLLASHTELARKLAELEKKYDSQFKIVFDAIACLNKLQTKADTKRAASGDYLRPIMLLQAEHKDTERDTLVPEKVKQALVDDFGIPAAEIAIATGVTDEIAGEDILSEKSRKPTSFSLQTGTDRFYPDFLCRMDDGRILVVEYKNSRDWDLPDNTEKRQLGELWERRSNGKGLFIMPRGKD